MHTRRKIIAGVGAAFVAGAGLYFGRDSKPVSGAIIGASAKLGHRIRNHDFPDVSSERVVDVVVAGGGIAGLSAARELQRLGVRDFVVLEAADRAGGNSASGENAISAYPWGAHYIPLVRNDDDELLKLCAAMGIIVDNRGELPVYNEYFLSADPQERLCMYGRWQEGLVPMLGASASDKDQYRRFFALVNDLKTARGNDGKPIFAIPVARSSADPSWRSLDRITMSDYLVREQFSSPLLRWYIDYCCRDDYGATADHVSAWAGLHYFAARNGRAANADTATMITWPEGNGFFTRAWSRELGERVELNKLVVGIESSKGSVDVMYFDAQTDRTIRVRARAAVLALPQFVTDRIINRNTKPELFDSNAREVAYSPWAVANLTLSARPRGTGVELAWDNVAYDSAMLGYVVANHQTASRPRPETVITYYWPLSHAAPATARQEALARSHYDWQVLFEQDLFRIHPELKGHLQHMDLMLWGHGMIRPTPNTIWNEQRVGLGTAQPPIFFAHSDLSGISIFEEAFHRGLSAARQCHQYVAQSSMAIA